jgi:hypothetical protein
MQGAMVHLAAFLPTFSETLATCVELGDGLTMFILESADFFDVFCDSILDCITIILVYQIAYEF